MEKPTLAERLKKLPQKKGDHAIFSLFLEDYFKGLDMAMGLGYFSVVYGTTFYQYDKNATVYLAEMFEKTIRLEPQKKAEILYNLLIEPFYYLKYIVRS